MPRRSCRRAIGTLVSEPQSPHVIRTNKIPFLQSRASPTVMALGVLVMVLGIALPFTFVGRYLGFTELPLLYWPILALTVVCYLLLTQAVKVWLLRRQWI